MSQNPLRQLPAVSRLLELPSLVAARSHHPHELIAAAAREDIESLRARLAAGEAPDLSLDAAAERIVAKLDASAAPALRPVINATGIVLHTNLGRSPLHEEAARAAHDAASGYLNLEF